MTERYETVPFPQKEEPLLARFELTRTAVRTRREAAHYDPADICILD